ncbi:tol-pal system protein YbgF [Dongia soli]|uniref:Cell division coordinator CpoB n=1 Tax=Dongia soli TaxID=600628 RepID=A0ABU5EAJ7_9PROT|nr:tol-pal system protein YbgF [Dongia soli]MDY0883377.1 tol-pal system protein YbgF [Dongia soli]
MLSAVLGACLFGGVLLPQSVRADEVDDLRAEVAQLRQQLQGMQGGVAANQEVRLQQMQQQMATLEGQVEQTQLKLNDLSDKLDRAQKDNEFRLNALEGGQGGAGAIRPAANNQPATPDMSGPNSGATRSNQAAGGGNAPNQSAGDQPSAPPSEPRVLGTLSKNTTLPQAPAGAAEAAAAAAGGTAAANAGSGNAGANTGGNIVLPGETPREQYEYATGLLQKGQYAEAEVALKTFVQEHPNDALTGNAQYWIGETYYARKDFKNASVAFAEGYQKYPNSPKAADNLLKLGMSLGLSGQNQNACVALKQLDKKFPDASGAIKDRASRAKQRFGC